MVKFLRHYLNFTGLLYLAVALVMFFILDAKQMRLYRLDTLSYCWSYPMLLSEGQDVVNPQKLHAAINYYKIASEVAKDNFRTYEMQGWCYFYLKDYTHSRLMFKKALDLSPHSFWLEYDLAAIAYQEGHCEKGEALLKHILQTDAQELCQGALLALLKSFPDQDRMKLFLQIPAFVNEARSKSFILLNYCGHSQDLASTGISIVPLMHPWSMVIPPGKESFYN